MKPITLFGPRQRLWAPPALVLTLLFGLPGCDTDPSPAAGPGEPELTPEVFVDVVVAIREAERELAREDSAAVLFEARKEEILLEHDVTEEELLAFLEERGRDVELLQEVWDSITQRLKHVPEGSDPFDTGLGRPVR